MIATGGTLLGRPRAVSSQRRTVIEPFKVKVVEPLPQPSRTTREHVLVEAGWNLFRVPARQVTFDFLTDSGTTAMSAAQWAAMMVADESYAGSRSFEALEAAVRRLTGYAHVIPTHQGRAAERLLDRVIEGVAEVVADRGRLRGMQIVEEPPFLRHFTARFAPR